MREAVPIGEKVGAAFSCIHLHCNLPARLRGKITFHLAEENVGLKWLAEQVNCARDNTCSLHTVVGGHDNNGDVCIGWVLLELGRKLIAGELRHHEVEQDKSRHLSCSCLLDVL
jgi:hypothetical protein